MIQNKVIPKQFKNELTLILNKFSIENKLDMPDHIITDYICDSLDALAKSVDARDSWFSVDMWAKDKKIKVLE